MKTRIPSTIVISILVSINMFFISAMMGVELRSLIGTFPQEPDEITLIWGGIVAGIALLFFHGWAISIAITHAVCLVFTIKNRRSPMLPVRVINIVLDVANVFLIIAPIVKIIIWRSTF